jgi:hypothetical protein
MKKHKRKKLKNIKIVKNLLDKKMVFHHLKNIEAKNITIERLDIQHSIIENSYFHNCEFKQCNFTGTQFLNSNFSSSKFINCNFDYAFFSKCTIKYSEILQNLPKYENIKIKFLKSLLINAIEMGDYEEKGQISLKIASTTMEYMKNILISNQSYYKTKYTNWNRLEAFFTLISSNLENMIWKFGSSYVRLLLSTLATIFFITIYSFFSNLEKAMPISDIFSQNSLSNLFSIFILNSKILLDIPYDQHLAKDSITFSLAILRYIALGLIINIFYSKHNKI